VSFHLFGLDPSSAVGKELMVSMRIWHPMLECLQDRYPDLFDDIKNGHINSGEKMNKDKAILLANEIDKDIDNGEISNHIALFNDFIKSLPDTDCYRCFGIGKQRSGIFKALSGPCEACRGSGRGPQFVARYTLALQDFAFFTIFLRHCGGFVIR